MSHPDLNPRGRADGATAVTEAPRRRRWLLPLLLALLALLAVLLLSRCGNDDDTNNTGANTGATTTPGASGTSLTSAPTDATTPSPTDPAATPSTTASASATDAAAAGAAGGSITAGSNVILGDGGVKDMAAYTGQSAQGRSVPVQSVPADEGFWAGTSATDRVWVQLTGEAGESPYQVKQGDLVDFTGTITPAASGCADEVGLTAAEGAEQLTQQKQYVLVKKSDVTLSE